MIWHTILGQAALMLADDHGAAWSGNTISQLRLNLITLVVMAMPGAAKPSFFDVGKARFRTTVKVLLAVAELNTFLRIARFKIRRYNLTNLLSTVYKILNFTAETSHLSHFEGILVSVG